MSILYAADNYPLPPRPPRVYRKPKKMSFLYQGMHKYFLEAEWDETIGCYIVRLNGVKKGGFRLDYGKPHEEFMQWIRSCWSYDNKVFEHGFNYIQEEGPELSKVILRDDAAKDGKPTE